MHDDDEHKAPKAFWIDRPSARTPDEREARFQQYLITSAPYNAAIIEAGDEPWWRDSEKLSASERSGLAGTADGGDVDRRRELFDRRYQRPEPPVSIPLKTLAQIRGDRRG